MEKKNLKKGAAVAGGIALMAAFSALCVKGLQLVDRRLKAKREAEAFDDEVDMEIAAAYDEVMKVGETDAEDIAEEILAEETVEPAEDKKPAE